MSAAHESNGRLPSTTWEWKKVMVRQRPEGPQQRRRAQRVPLLSRRNPREALTVSIRFRGGPEAWWEIKARGRVWRVPGYVCIQDLGTWINEGHGGKVP